MKSIFKRNIVTRTSKNFVYLQSPSKTSIINMNNIVEVELYKKTIILKPVSWTFEYNDENHIHWEYNDEQQAMKDYEEIVKSFDLKN